MAYPDVRRAQPDHQTAVGDLWAQLLEEQEAMEERFGVAEDARDRWENDFPQWLDDETYRVYVAEVDGEVVGFATAHRWGPPPIYAESSEVFIDELYVRLKQDGTEVSRATVYNTLELLLECDLVVRHQFGKNQAKYERAYSYWQHDHLICMDCNELFEFCDPRLQSIQEMVADIYEFEIKHHSLNMYGHCIRENCPNRAEDSDRDEADSADKTTAKKAATNEAES